MKRFLPVLLLLLMGAPLFASDEDGDPGYIPSFAELVREGYGPSYRNRSDMYDRPGYGYYPLLHYGVTTAPMPTQAYYGKGYTIYYGYTPVPVWRGSPAEQGYAFGYPAEYFRRLLPDSLEGVDLKHYAIEVHNSMYGPGDYVAQNGGHRSDAVTTVQRVTTTTTTTTAPSNGTNPLPAIGEKPVH
jgi:hypothetical protein